MPYGRRRRRTYSGRRRRYRSLGGYRPRRSKMSKKSRLKVKSYRKRRRVVAAGKIACPVVYECLKKIADSNVAYNIKDCDGVVRTSVIDPDLPFAGTGFQFFVSGGPFTDTTDEIESCGYLGIPYYRTPDGANKGLHVTACNTAREEYAETPLQTHIFPMIPRTNPTAGANYNPLSCRESDHTSVTLFDNRHTLRIQWPPYGLAEVEISLQQFTRQQKLIMHEVCWWISDLSTVEDNALVSLPAAIATDALAQVDARKKRRWLRQMYNAYFCNHPLPDTTVVDVIDLTTGSDPLDTFNESLAANARLSIVNTNIRGRDTLAFLAAGVQDRRKDAHPIWHRKKTFRRPHVMASQQVGITVHETGNANDCVVPDASSYVKAGKKFKIGKKMVWDKLVPVAVPDLLVREVVPRGCYMYCQYWWYLPNTSELGDIPGDLAPHIFASRTKWADRMLITKWQNM